MALKPSKEWMTQASYDFETAKAMLTAGRYIYTVFMCHLSIEKVLKGIYAQQLNKTPPKTHDLNYLCQKADLSLPDKIQKTLDNLNDLSIPTRYPDTLEILLKQFSKIRTKKILDDTKELLIWLQENISYK